MRFLVAALTLGVLVGAIPLPDHALERRQVAAPPPAPTAQPVQPGVQITGQATFEVPGPKKIGSCGYDVEELAFSVAINKAQMANGPNPNENPNCRKSMTVQYNNVSVMVEITDTCESCQPGEIVLSHSAGSQLGQEFVNKGRNTVVWVINS
ncbi:hypothetical protein H4R33_000233 [Dimargaris cristalligena]|uniref:RlpA-like double-psi beta-barrel-protein domain-containing protein-containing protein n=1 Tax=Dimargaris cristalligena TaxID=215637 RepID=A0A4P9ZW84_9FUNG|nr:hypothetical protein H4R33_000233 [Dimargaris cristalligena]RKP37877.1 hypothetical protein BJ085DRAFT_38832 [Dimargaris cristalligena]|eukprot:RKP37877.1 hypothetical protein BJ085DRAFT_38832 [Dimargaris cristalligena]